MVLAGVGVGHLHIKTDDQLVAHAGAARGGAVDRNARTALGGDGVGGEALAVIHVVNIDRFIFQNAAASRNPVDGAGPFYSASQPE